MRKKKLVRLQLDVSDEHLRMFQAMRQFYQISKQRELAELVILGAALDVASLPPPANMTVKQKEGYKWCHQMAVKYAKPFKKLLQKRKADDKSNKIKKSKRR